MSLKRYSELCQVDLLTHEPLLLEVENKKFLVPCFELARIFVHEKFRCQGLGNNMLDRIIAFADKFRYAIVLTDSTAYGSDSIRLRELYYRKGFRLCLSFGIQCKHPLVRLPIKKAA
jgi:GNAT superfamily N-acetyltransferase